MPNIDVIYPDLKDWQQDKLAKGFTDILLEIFPCLTPQSVVIRFPQLGSRGYAVGGRLVEAFGYAGEPTAIFQIDIGWYAGKTEQQQEQAAKRLTESAAAIMKFNPKQVEINIFNMHRGNHFEGGKRLDVPEPK